MGEKTIPTLLIGTAVGVIVACLFANRVYAGRSSGEIADLNQRYNQLSREYTERQQVIEYQQRFIGERVDECIGYVENAGSIIERTGENAGGAIQNLREASILIEQGIKEKQDLKMELDNLRAGLYRIRDIYRLQVE